MTLYAADEEGIQDDDALSVSALLYGKANKADIYKKTDLNGDTFHPAVNMQICFQTMETQSGGCFPEVRDTEAEKTERERLHGVNEVWWKNNCDDACKLAGAKVCNP